ncbi:MAG: hypothetical protein ACOX1A_02460 [Saccharofermentanales bacterium]|nr:hypothetical protein [Clostridiaceae bacterium]
MNWLNIELSGMHLLFWLFSVLIAVVLFVLTLIWLAIGAVGRKKAVRTLSSLSQAIDELPGRSLNHVESVRILMEQVPKPAFAQAFAAMEKTSADSYRSQWFPDPARFFKVERLFGSATRAAASPRPAGQIMGVGILGSLTTLLLQSQISPPNEMIRIGLILLPGLIALACVLFLLAGAQKTFRTLTDHLSQLHLVLADHLPVFNDQAGLALLIDEFLIYDRQMKATLETFTETTGRLASQDMADGIRHGVEQVMLNSVAPPIQQAAATLSNLAVELTQRQERGMQELAVQFANALGADLAGHLQPINKEIDLMRTLMSDVRNYIEYAMRALETTRGQSESLLADSKQALQQIAEAHLRLSSNFAQVDEQSKTLAEASTRMAAVYSGNEQGLAEAIAQFGRRLDEYSQQMQLLLNDAVAAMDRARASAGEQQASAGNYLGIMQQQVDNLSDRLGSEVQGLFQQVRQETDVIAGHTRTIGEQLGALNTTLERTLADFTEASAGYVNKTLTDFDAGLAELATRMARTADEIRDAVDALPRALQYNQGQVARFDG